MHGYCKTKLQKESKGKWAHYGVITKLIKEVVKIIRGDSTTIKASTCLKVIDKQPESQLCFLTKVNEEASLLCELDEIEYNVKESETTTAKIIECKCRIDDNLPGSRNSSSHPPSLPVYEAPLSNTKLIY